MTAAESEGQRAERVARLSAWLCVLGLSWDALTSPAPATLIQVAAIAVCGVGALYLQMVHGPASFRRGTTVFLIVNSAVLVSLWVSTRSSADLGIAWVPFRENRLGALTIALLAPPRVWVGIATICGFVGTACLQLALFPSAIRDRLAYGDPWATLAYGGFAIALLVYRLRSTRVDREIAQAQAEAESFELLARAMVAVRDLANTPLQTISNVVEILSVRDERSRDLGLHLSRALGRLIELEKLTRPYERQLAWRTGDEAWDPKAILRAIADKTST